MSGLSVFAFGKLPSHGDFVARGLAAGERTAWDDWASAGVEQARRALGEGFEAAHDQALPWRFAFGDAGFGPGRRAGVISPSVDRAGRRFLIVLGVQAVEGLASRGAGADAAERLEAQLYQAFAAGLDVDALAAAAAAALADLDPGASEGGGRFWSETEDPGAPADVAAHAPPADLVLRMLVQEASHV